MYGEHLDISYSTHLPSPSTDFRIAPIPARISEPVCVTTRMHAIAIMVLQVLASSIRAVWSI